MGSCPWPTLKVGMLFLENTGKHHEMLELQEFFHVHFGGTIPEAQLPGVWGKARAEHSTLQYVRLQLWSQVKTGFAQYIEGRMFDAT